MGRRPLVLLLLSAATAFLATRGLRPADDRPGRPLPDPGPRKAARGLPGGELPPAQRRDLGGWNDVRLRLAALPAAPPVALPVALPVLDPASLSELQSAALAAAGRDRILLSDLLHRVERQLEAKVIRAGPCPRPSSCDRAAVTIAAKVRTGASDFTLGDFEVTQSSGAPLPAAFLTCLQGQLGRPADVVTPPVAYPDFEGHHQKVFHLPTAAGCS
jgi:hypothetical protein